MIGSSIDSYVLSLLLETGIPGLMFFTGLLLIPVWYGLRNYLSDASEAGAAAGAVACSFVAFTANRLVLSQKENHMLIFSLLAIVVILNYEYARKRIPAQLSRKLGRQARARLYEVSPMRVGARPRRRALPA